MRTAVRLLVPAAVLALLVGCTADPEPTRPTPDRTQAEEQRLKVADDGSAPVDGGTEAAAGDLAACLQGTWEVAPEATEAAARAGMGMNGGETYGATVTVTGTQTATFGPDTIVNSYEDQTITIAMEVEGMSVEAVTRISGQTVQSYLLDGDVIAIAGTDMSGATFESLTYVNGEQMSIPGYDEQMDATMTASAGMGGSARLRCTATTLTQVPLVAGTEIPDLTATMTRR